MRLTSRRSQPPLVLSVPLSRFTSQVGGGSAFYVRRHSTHDEYRDTTITDSPVDYCDAPRRGFACLLLHPCDHRSQSGQCHASESQDRVWVARRAVRRCHSCPAYSHFHRSRSLTTY